MVCGGGELNCTDMKLLLDSDHKELKTLNLDGCKNLDDDVVEFLKIPNLEELNLGSSNWSNVRCYWRVNMKI